MNAATLPLPLSATSKPVRRGFACTCIRCGNVDAVVTVNLADVSEFKCTECDEEFSAADVREFIEQWQAVLTWIDAAPAIEE